MTHSIKAKITQGGCGRDGLVVEFTTTYAIRAYHHCSELESRSWRGVLNTILCIVFTKAVSGGLSSNY
jgi:hypothetical protein